MHRTIITLFCAFALSGFCGLIYESIWAKYLRLFLGHAAYAQAVVLVVFIGGLAIGAWLAGRRAERIRRPLLLYAGVELVVGVFGLLFHALFTSATRWGYDWLLPNTCSSSGPCASAFALAASLILPQSILLGATFPLMAAGVLRLQPKHAGGTVALLYFLNSIGAVVGVLVVAWCLLPLLGLPGTVMTGGALNITIALVVVATGTVRGTAPPYAAPTAAMEQDRPNSPAAASRPSSTRAGGAAAKATPAARRASSKANAADAAAVTGSPAVDLPATPAWPLWVAALTGFSSFVYEVVWIRMLAQVLGSSAYAFDLMLASFILGIALGGLWIRRRIDGLPDPPRFLAQVQVAMGLLALGGLVYYNFSFDAMAWGLNALPRSDVGYGVFNVGSALLAMGLMLPATFTAGMTLPLLTAMLARTRLGERSIGFVYAANSVGSIAGVIAAVALAFTVLGVRLGLIAAASIDILLGIWIFYRTTTVRGAVSLWTAVGLGGIAVALMGFHIDALKAASGVYRLGQYLEPGTRIEFHRDGRTATVDVVRYPEGVLSIRTNGKPDASAQTQPRRPPTLDEYTATLLAALPLAYRPDLTRAAVIGFGSGMTTAVLLDAAHIQRVDTIEIEPAMVDGARAFLPRVERAFGDPRSRIVFDDARAYFARSNETYDIIVSEPSNPWVSGVASLFTAEFYERAKRQLKVGGLFVQWLQCYEFDLALLAEIVNALDESFADYAVYALKSELIIVASSGRSLGQVSEQALREPALAADLQRIGLGQPSDVFALFAGSRTTVDGYIHAAAAASNSDYYPVVELGAPKRRFLGSGVTDFEDLAVAPIPLTRTLDPRAPAIGQPISPPQSPEMATLIAYRRAELSLGFFNAIAPGDPRPMLKYLAPQMQALRDALVDCTNPQQIASKWDDVVTAAGMLNPFLPPERLDPFWARLEQSTCLAPVSLEYRNWLALFRAVGNRNSAVMARSAKALLGTPLTVTQFEYCFLAEVTALLTQGRREEALWWFGRVRTAAPASTQAKPWFRLAYQLARATG